MITLEIQNDESKKDRKVALLSSIGSIVLFIVITILIKFTISPPLPVDLPPLKSDEVIEEFIVERTNVEVTDNGGSAGMEGGTASNHKLDDPQEQTEEIITQTSNPDNQVFSGKSENNNTDNNNTNTSSSTAKSPNPFGSGGSGGEKGAGRGGDGPFGKDNGDGDGTGGKGNGSGQTRREPRQRLSDPAPVESNYSGIVVLMVTINAEGTVVKASNINGESTITDARIINQYIANVKSSVRFNKMPGTKPQTQKITISVKAS